MTSNSQLAGLRAALRLVQRDLDSGQGTGPADVPGDPGTQPRLGLTPRSARSAGGHVRAPMWEISDARRWQAEESAVWALRGDGDSDSSDGSDRDGGDRGVGESGGDRGVGDAVGDEYGGGFIDSDGEGSDEAVRLSAFGNGRCQLVGTEEGFFVALPDGRFWPAGAGPLPLGGEGPEAVVAVAVGVQESFAEILWFTWPRCPEHATTLRAEACDGTATWRCDTDDGHDVAPIGRLAHAHRRPSAPLSADLVTARPVLQPVAELDG